MIGKLIGIGLGPGDPELMTRKAHRLIGLATVVAYPTSPNGESFARAIAADSITSGTREIAIAVPMTPERAPAQAAYDKAATQIAEVLTSGENVVYLCEGDPLLFGSFMYLQARLAAQFQCEIVPGVSSVNAAAAAANRPLAARNEMLSIIPAPMPEADLEARIAAADAVAIMKVGRHMGKLRTLLGTLGLLESAVYIERASLSEERVMPLIAAPDPAPYFSMILVTKETDPWL